MHTMSPFRIMNHCLKWKGETLNKTLINSTVLHTFKNLYYSFYVYESTYYSSYISLFKIKELLIIQVY